ncbi:MAG: DEAD/DEAH box helicase [Candidatus Aenigmarchaeota archaeon]|nr:DEAD/DEAH box helicase [Candidatus Aenigmarchaeota archaeon]
MSFEIFSQKIKDTIKKSGFEKPTVPQQLAMKPILEGNNVLLIAQTGLGKTESVMLPIFDMWLKNKPKPISILYLTPLKSLNRDLLRRFLWWSEQLEMDISVRHGDTSAYERKKQVDFPDDLLVSTPETLQAILPAKKMRENLRNVRWVVIDEIHELADSKRGIQLTVALERLRELCGNFQLIALSATVGNPEEIAKFISGNRNMKIIKATSSKEMKIEVISPKKDQSDNELLETIPSLSIAARLRKVYELINQHASTLVFTNTRDFAEILTSRLKQVYPNLSVANHHSSLSKSVRINVEEEFKNQKLKTIVCTSSLELGIDIGSIDFILHYMSPREPARAIQRIGRSGHEHSRISKGVIIATDIDDLFESVVIAKQALQEKLQSLKIHYNALDVLAQQIVGITRDKYKISINEAYDLIRKAYPYRDLTKDQFVSVCRQMNSLKYLFLDEDAIRSSKKGLIYYFENLSTIPDTKNYSVINMISNDKVGTLDEEFVAIHGIEGSTFIIKGEPWHIVSVEATKIYVEPSGDIDASIPGWEGDLMPVPFEVAQEVGSIRNFISIELKNSIDKHEILKQLKQKYPIDDNSGKRMINVINKQIKYGVPTDKQIIAEIYEDVLILHTCFGSVVNETLGRFLSSMLATRIGSVGLKIDPYRIVLQFQKINLDIFKEIIYKTSTDNVEPLMEITLPNTKLFQWKFLHVAKKFGVIKKDADFSRIRIDKIIDIYTNTPIWEETLREIKTEKLDIIKTKEILDKIQKNQIKLVFNKGLSPLGKIGLKQKPELVGPEKPDLQILDIFEKRLMSKKVELICMNCGGWYITMKIKDVPDIIRCDKCHAKLIGVISHHRHELINLVKKKLKNSLTIEEQKIWDKINRTSDLVIVYGKKAVMALATRGVGPQTAVRILRGMYFGEKDFLRALLEAERNFIRTKKFWG